MNRFSTQLRTQPLGAARSVATAVVGLALAAGLALAGCGDSGSKPAKPTPKPAPAAPAPKPAPAPSPTPAAGAGKDGGAIALGNAAKGKEQYVMLCSSCHGPSGCGDGPLSATLQPTPANHCDGNYMNGLTNASIFDVIKKGGPAVGKSPLMAAWGGSLSDDQIRDVLAFIRSVAKPPYKGS